MNGTRNFLQKTKELYLQIKENRFSRTMFFTAVIGCVFSALSFSCYSYVSGAIFLIMTVLAFNCCLGQAIYLKDKKISLNLFIALMCFLLVIPGFTSFDASRKYIGTFVWENTTLNEMLPKPHSHSGTILANTDNKLIADVKNISKNQADSYIKACKALGYTRNSCIAENFYTGFDLNGNNVSVNYNYDQKSLFIIFNKSDIDKEKNDKTTVDASVINASAAQSADNISTSPDSVNTDIDTGYSNPDASQISGVTSFAQTNNTSENVPVNISGAVYITPSGKKYHTSSLCAGKNAIETTFESARNTHEPCKKCVK